MKILWKCVTIFTGCVEKLVCSSFKGNIHGNLMWSTVRYNLIQSAIVYRKKSHNYEI